MCRGLAVRKRAREGVHVHTGLDDVHTELGVAGNQTTSAALWNMSIKVVVGAGGAGLVLKAGSRQRAHMWTGRRHQITPQGAALS